MTSGIAKDSTSKQYSKKQSPKKQSPRRQSADSPRRQSADSARRQSVDSPRRQSISPEVNQSNYQSSVAHPLEVSTPRRSIRTPVDFSAFFAPPDEKLKLGLHDLSERLRRHHDPQFAPEYRINVFAFRLAFVTKAANASRTLAFLLATIIILGGLATSLSFEDFWVTALITFAEALRYFFGSHELRWKMISSQDAEGEKSKAKSGSPDSAPAWNTISVVSPSVSPLAGYILKPQNIINLRILYIIQIVFAGVCIGLALWRLILQKFCFEDPDAGQRCPGFSKNIAFVMSLFYIFAVIEVAFLLIEKGYFEYRMTYKQLLREMRKELFDGKLDRFVLEKFYLTVYAASLKGSIFDALDMNFVVFGTRWLQSDDLEQQLHGAKLLGLSLAANKKIDYEQDSQAAEALRILGRTPGIMERLVEMLCWNSDEEEELVCEIAPIVKRLISSDYNWSRFVAVPGAMDAIVSILLPHAEDSRRILGLRITGLKILKYLCTSYAKSLEIGQTRGLVSILVLFIQPQSLDAPPPDRDAEAALITSARWKVYKNCLHVLYCLSTNRSTSGRALRQHIACIAPVVKTLRDVIEACDDRPMCQLLSMGILHNMALEDEVRTSIGATGGVIRLHFKIFQQNDAVLEGTQSDRVIPCGTDAENKLQQQRRDAIKMSGMVLSRLTLQNKGNCLALLALEDKEKKKAAADILITSLHGGDENHAVSAAEILRNILQFANEGTKLEIAEITGPITLRNISNLSARTNDAVYEAHLGLASQSMESLELASYRKALTKGIAPSDREYFMRQLIHNLEHSPAASEVPKRRRYSVEVIVALVERDDYFLDAFAKLNLKKELEIALDNVSEMENFFLFVGLMGYARHIENIDSLILRCIAAAEPRSSSQPALLKDRASSD